MWPPPIRAALGRMPRIAWAVTDLPEPDSPTSATVRPAGMSRDSPSTARNAPVAAEKSTLRSRIDRSGAVILVLRLSCDRAGHGIPGRGGMSRCPPKICDMGTAQGANAPPGSRDPAPSPGTGPRPAAERVRRPSMPSNDFLLIVSRCGNRMIPTAQDADASGLNQRSFSMTVGMSSSPASRSLANEPVSRAAPPIATLDSEFLFGRFVASRSDPAGIAERSIDNRYETGSRSAAPAHSTAAFALARPPLPSGDPASDRRIRRSEPASSETDRETAGASC